MISEYFIPGEAQVKLRWAEVCLSFHV